MNRVEIAVDDGVGRAPTSSGTTEVAVVVPVLSGAVPLDRLYSDYSRALAQAGYAFEFIFVIEPWARESVEPLYSWIDAGAPIRILEAGQAIGETAMLVAAVEQTSAPVVITLIPDFRVEPAALGVLADRVATGGADVASARRTRGNRTWANRLLSGWYHALLRMSVGGDLRDLGSGARAVRREVFPTLPLFGDTARYLPVLALREGHRVEEVPVAVHPEHQRLKLYTPGIYVRRLIDLLGITFLSRFSQKPLRFFGLAGTVLLTWGIVVLGVLFIQRFGGQPLATRPILLLGTLLVVLGFQAIALGLIGEVIVHLMSLRRQHYRVRSVHSFAPVSAQRSETRDNVTKEMASPGRDRAQLELRADQAAALGIARHWR
jgi:hypothetical protein